MNQEHTLVLDVDHTPDTILKGPIAESASFPLTRSDIKCEAVCGVGFAHPPSSTDSKLWQLSGGDEGSKTIPRLR